MMGMMVAGYYNKLSRTFGGLICAFLLSKSYSFSLPQAQPMSLSNINNALYQSSRHSNLGPSSLYSQRRLSCIRHSFDRWELNNNKDQHTAVSLSSFSTTTFMTSSSNNNNNSKSNSNSNSKCSIKNVRGGAHKLYSSLNGDDNGSNGSNGVEEEDSDSSTSNASKPPQDANQSKAKGQTGWNHNLPSSDSDFWSTVNTEATNLTKDANQRQLKTGWLHNTRSASSSSASSSTDNDNDNANDKKKGGLYQARRLLQLEKMKQKINHRIPFPPTFHPCGNDRRVALTEHLVRVPLDHAASTTGPDELDPNEDRIDVYFTVVDLIQTDDDELFYRSLGVTGNEQERDVSTETVKANMGKRTREAQRRATEYKQYTSLHNANHCCLYLQGGPGFGAPTPIVDIGLGDDASWIGAALGKGFNKVVLMDQRGTGRSTPVTKQTLQKQFPDLFALDDTSSSFDRKTEGDTLVDIEGDIRACEVGHPEEAGKLKNALLAATDYMSHFRADNIVKDAEVVKDSLLLVPEDDDDEDDEAVQPARPWGAALGQSFGGFCLMTYLSLIPHPPKICLLTGGIAPMLTPVHEAYTRLRKRVRQRNLVYYERYPGDIQLVKRIVNRLLQDPPRLPSGGTLTARRFLQLGIGLGGSPSAFASLHSLLSSAFLSDDGDDLSRSFLKRIDTVQPFDDNPIYFLLHESIYADGNNDNDNDNAHSTPTDWAAHRATSNNDDFDHTLPSRRSGKDSTPTLLYGETIFPWMADGDYAELSGLGMRSLAHRLATKDDWGNLYDVERMREALAKDDGSGGDTRAAAAVYYDDMYVDFDAAMEVVGRGGPLEGCKVWVTNEYQHSGLRDDGAVIVSKLLGMARGTDGTPS